MGSNFSNLFSLLHDKTKISFIENPLTDLTYNIKCYNRFKMKWMGLQSWGPFLIHNINDLKSVYIVKSEYREELRNFYILPNGDLLITCTKGKVIYYDVQKSNFTYSFYMFPKALHDIHIAIDEKNNILYACNYNQIKIFRIAINEQTLVNIRMGEIIRKIID